MVGQRRRAFRRKPTAGNHQRSWLWGRNAVLETLHAGRWIPQELVLSDSASVDLDAQVREFAESLEVPLQIAPNDRLTELAHARDHQGILAKLPAFPYADVEQILAESGQDQLCLVLDAIQDPFNFGAICRVACVYGADGVLTGSRNQAEVTPHVVRSSAGAVSRLNVARTSQLAESVARLSEGGLRIIGTSPRASQTIDQVDLTGPVSIVIGSEGHGLDAELEAACHELVRIPQAVSFDSLNAAVAAGILCYETHRQRSTQNTPRD